MKRMVGALVIGLMVSNGAVSSGHPIETVTLHSICHYEEDYYAWTAGEPWLVFGRVRPTHRDKRVILQESKQGQRWRVWKKGRTDDRGRYRFKGITPSYDGWHSLLRVVYPAQDDHDRQVSRRIYVDNNPLTDCD